MKQSATGAKFLLGIVAGIVVAVVLLVRWVATHAKKFLKKA